MMGGDEVLLLAAGIGLVMVAGGIVASLVRIVLGPGRGDRALGFGMLILAASGLGCLIALRTGEGIALDLGIGAVLLGVFATAVLLRTDSGPGEDAP